MDRKEFFEKSLKFGLCSGALVVLGGTESSVTAQTPPEELARVTREKEFIQNWLIDLLDTMETELDRESAEKLLAGCGRGCFRRHEFKQKIAERGKGDVDKLIEAYKQNFEVWREGETVHIRYGEVSNQCYCPAANYRTSKPQDIHCECTRSTHQTIFETALGRSIRVEIVESLRRGGKTCHFRAHLA